MRLLKILKWLKVSRVCVESRSEVIYRVHKKLTMPCKEFVTIAKRHSALSVIFLVSLCVPKISQKIDQLVF